MNSAVVVITGCSTGIGRELAKTLSEKGYTVVATARKIDSLKDLTVALKLEMDVASSLSIQEAAEAIKSRFGRVDILINNAGYAIRGAVEELVDEEVKKMFEVNVFGVIRTIRAFVPIMRDQNEGKIVNIGSIGGKISMPINGSYAATKFALEGLTDALRLEVRPFGIKTILIEPGNIRTNFVGTAMKQAGAVLKNPYSPYVKLNSAYGKVMTSLRKHEPGPEVVARVVLKSIRSKKPRTRYLAAVPLTTRLMLLLGDNVRDMLYGKIFKIT